MASGREIGRRVKAARARAGMTQKEYAAHLGIAGNTLAKIENGQDVQAGKLRLVVDALGIEVDPVRGDEHAIESARLMVELWMQALPDSQRGAALSHIARAMADFDGRS